MDYEYLWKEGHVGENLKSFESKVICEKPLYFSKVAQKSGPTPNRDQLRVFYNADEKTGYILIIFNYYRKVHSTAILTSRGTNFLELSTEVSVSSFNRKSNFDIRCFPMPRWGQYYSYP